MTTDPNTAKDTLNVLTINGITITKDIAKQLDELQFQDWEDFEARGRCRTGIDHGNTGIELLGRHKKTGALVRMWHLSHPIWTPRLQGNTFVPPQSDGLDELRDRLTAEYSLLPLIVLPREARQ